MNTNRILMVIWFLAGLISFSGCKDDILPEITTLDVNRAFSPTELGVSVVNRTGVMLTWKAVNNAKSYTVEIFETADFSGSPVKRVENISFDQVPYTISGLEGATAYSVRVKAVGEGIDDSKWVTATFKTDEEQIFQNLTAADLTANSVTLRWIIPNDVTHIMIGSTRYNITDQEKLAGEKTIEGLTPKTAYTAVLYLDTRLRGSLTFTTTPLLPTGPGVVLVEADANLATLIQAAVDGNIFVLREGTKYTADDPVYIPANVSITIWGEVGATMPVVAFNGFNLPANAGTIKFENVDLTGYQNGDATQTKRNYVFNQSAASNTDAIVFENCRIRNFTNAVVRLQSATIESVTVNNCTVYDIGDNGTAGGSYAFIHTTASSGKINNISIANSTFYKIAYGLIVHSAASSQSVLVENCTFNNIIGDARYFIDYNTGNSVSSFVLSNNIIGKTFSPAGSGRGIRAGTSPSVTNTYKTSDAVFSANLIPNIKSYLNASTSLFTDPDNGNFLIKDGAFAGKGDSGDPRWRP